MDKKILILVILLAVGWFLTKNKKVDMSIVAQPGQLSENGKYSNMTPLKHDFFKFTLCVFIISALFTDVNKPLFDLNDLNNSTLGKGLIAGTVFALFHLYVEPVVNYLPKW